MCARARVCVIIVCACERVRACVCGCLFVLGGGGGGGGYICANIEVVKINREKRVFFVSVRQHGLNKEIMSTEWPT